MFKCPKCKSDMVYDWLLARVMCINATCGFDTDWQTAMDHCKTDSGKGFLWCPICKEEKFCTVTDDSITCLNCDVNLVEHAAVYLDGVAKRKDCPAHEFATMTDGKSVCRNCGILQK